MRVGIVVTIVNDKKIVDNADANRYNKCKKSKECLMR